MKKLFSIGIIILFLGLSISSSTGFNTNEQSVQPLSSGNIFYVGGSGPGNYTKIQDAIDNASDGDTVFVYNGTYFEYNISIDNSIDFIGENKNSTVIDCDIINCNILILTNGNTTVKGFTIDGYAGCGVLIYSRDNKILDCRFINHEEGIIIGGSNNVISNCNFDSVGWGIEITGEKDIIIDNCNFTIWDYCIYGIIVKSPLTNLKLQDCVFYGFDGNCILFDAPLDNSNISNCKFIENYASGIYFNQGVERSNIYQCVFNNNYHNGIKIIGQTNQINVIRCHFEGNEKHGLYLSKGDGNYIYQNNFINNSRHHARSWGRNIWNNGKIGNYWDNWIGFRFDFFIFLPYRVCGFFNWDWHPAKEPYDI